MPLNRDMSPHLLLGVVLIGFGVGFLSGAFGKGGSAIATPLLHLIGIPAIVAIASPLPATIPSTWLASRVYSRNGNVNRRVVRIGLPIGLVLTVAGALLTRWIPGGPLIVVTDIVVLAFGLRILLNQLGPGHDERERERAATDAIDDARPTAARIMMIVAVVGFVSGLLGNSGGFLLAPLFMGVLGMPIHRALGTSLVLATCLASSGHARALVAGAHRLVADARLRSRIGTGGDVRCATRNANQGPLAQPGVRRRADDARRRAPRTRALTRPHVTRSRQLAREYRQPFECSACRNNAECRQPFECSACQQSFDPMFQHRVIARRGTFGSRRSHAAKRLVMRVVRR